jgi:hypothetical protein
LSLKVETLEKEMRVLSAMQFVSSSLPWHRFYNTSMVTHQCAWSSLMFQPLCILKRLEIYCIWCLNISLQTGVADIRNMLSRKLFRIALVSLWWVDFFFTWNSGFQVIWRLPIHSMRMLTGISSSLLKSSSRLDGVLARLQPSIRASPLSHHLVPPSWWRWTIYILQMTRGAYSITVSLLWWKLCPPWNMLFHFVDTFSYHVAFLFTRRPVRYTRR